MSIRYLLHPFDMLLVGNMVPMLLAKPGLGLVAIKNRPPKTSPRRAARVITPVAGIKEWPIMAKIPAS